MQYAAFSVVISLFFVNGLSVFGSNSSPEVLTRRQQSPNRLDPAGPIRFEPNLGQAPPDVRYIGRGPNSLVLLRSSGAEFQQFARSAGASRSVKLQLLGASPSTAAKPSGSLPSVTNYFLGADRTKWKANVPNFAKVTFASVYPGIDLAYHESNEYGDRARLEYDFIIHPGGDPNRLRFAFQGADLVRMDNNGDLIIKAGQREFRQTKPSVYQESQEGRRKVAGHYRLDQTSGEVAFTLGSYDRSIDLVVDPTIVYATYLGGQTADAGTAIASDPSGAVYIAGYTSGGFPTRTPYQAALGGATDIFVSKFDAAGALVYSTYLGGASGESAAGIAIDSSGAAYIVGFATGAGYPVLNAAQSTYGGKIDAVITKLTPAGVLAWSTYFGGPEDEIVSGIATDQAGAAYIVGYSTGGTPTLNAAQSTVGGGKDIFISKFSTAGVLTYSTYIGGPTDDTSGQIAVHSTGMVYVCGTTQGQFPVKAAMQNIFAGPSNFGTDAFVAKLNTDGSLGYATYLGGPQNDRGTAIAVDNTGAAWVGGSTSGDFPIVNPNAQQSVSSPGGSPAFVAKLDALGVLTWSTYLGASSGSTQINGIAIDVNGYSAYVGGETGAGFPVLNAPQSTFGGGSTDLFLTKYNRGGSIIYSTYAGGTGEDHLGAVAVDSLGGASIVGYNTSGGFPAVNAYQAAPGAGTSVILEKLGASSTTAIYSLNPNSAVSGGPGFVLTIAGTGFMQGAVVTWNSTLLNVISLTSDQIQVGVPPNVIGAPGNVSIVVTNPTEPASDPAVLKVTAAAVVPAITTARFGYKWDASGNLGSQYLDIFGTDFQAGAVVTLNGVAQTATSVGGALRLEPVPAAASQPGASVTVTNPGAAASPAVFLPVPPAPATLTSLSPSQVVAGTGSFSLTVNGTNFNAQTTSVYLFPIGPLPAQFISSTQLRVTVPSLAANTPKTLQVWIVQNVNNFHVDGAIPSTNQLPLVVSAGTCTYSLSRYFASAPANPQTTQTIGVTTSPGCNYPAVSNVPWISANGTGSGTGSLGYTVAQNISQGRRSGTVTIADQTLSVRQQSFATQVQASGRDFRGSGVEDVFLYDPATGDSYAGLSNGVGGFTYSYTLFTPAFDVVRNFDWSGDGKGDLLVYNSSTALGYVGKSNGDGTFGFSSLFWGPGFTQVTSAHIRGTTNADVAFYRPTDGTLYTSAYANQAFTYTYSLVSAGFTHIRLGDFDGNGTADILLYRQSDGLCYLGLSNGSGSFTFSPVPTGAGFDIVEVEYMDSTRKASLLLYSSTTGAAYLGKFANGFAFTGFTWSPGFTTVKLLDYNGDSIGDVALYNKNNTVGYLLTGSANGNFTSSSLFWGGGMSTVRIQDLNSDGRDDVVIYNPTNGAAYTGLSTGNPAAPFTYQYSYWGNTKMLSQQ